MIRTLFVEGPVDSGARFTSLCYATPRTAVDDSLQTEISLAVPAALIDLPNG
jgi:hypothetical protein